MLITPNHHPDWSSPIISTPDRLVETANATFHLIHQKPNRAVTIHYPPEDLTESFAIAKSSLAKFTSGGNDRITINFTTQTISDIENPVGDTLHSGLHIDNIHLLIGPIFARQLRLNMQLGPGRMEITAHDSSNKDAHIDSTGRVRDHDKNLKAPEHGITVTTSLNRNGTDLIDIIDGELERGIAQTPFSEREVWEYRLLGSLEGRVWHTTENTTVVTRSKDWDAHRKPCPHKSAFREKDNDPETGIVARSFIQGLG